MDHGSEICQPETKFQSEKLESVQYQAGVALLKLNRHTSGVAVGRSMGYLSAESRRQVRQLKYAMRLEGMEPDRWPRHVHTVATNEAARNPQSWAHRLAAFVDDDMSLTSTLSVGGDLTAKAKGSYLKGHLQVGM